MQFIGVDPALRHTGVCLRRAGVPQELFEAKTNTRRSILDSGESVVKQLNGFWTENLDPGVMTVAGIERQMLQGIRYTGLQFYAQMLVMQTLKEFFEKASALKHLYFVAPMPVQLKAYMTHLTGKQFRSKTPVVEAALERYFGKRVRLSSHVAESMFLAEMAQDVWSGKWTYTRPRKEISLCTLPILYDRLT